MLTWLEAADGYDRYAGDREPSWGARPPLLLLHGDADNTNFWGTTSAPLCATYAASCTLRLVAGVGN